jgi:hypothetical protein
LLGRRLRESSPNEHWTETHHEGETVGRTADASDDKAVARVEFYIDGAVIATDTYEPYETSIRTRRVAPGQHRITATAYDAEGLSATDFVTVTR